MSAQVPGRSALPARAGSGAAPRASAPLPARLPDLRPHPRGPGPTAAQPGEGGRSPAPHALCLFFLPD